MSLAKSPDSPKVLQLHTTTSYPCSYLAGRSARAQVAKPDHLINSSAYAELIKLGFRRSSTSIYRPACQACQACVSVRILVSQFQPNRTQRRIQRTHGNLRTILTPLRYDETHYLLYQRYQLARHNENGLSHEIKQDSRTQYQAFLLQSQVTSQLVEFHAPEIQDSSRSTLQMISVIDLLPDGLSAVYTFYEPEITRASFGTYSILWQIEQAKRLGLPYVYLGYWVRDSRKMAYKTNFSPLEGFIDGQWQALNPSSE